MRKLLLPLIAAGCIAAPAAAIAGGTEPPPTDDGTAGLAPTPLPSVPTAPTQLPSGPVSDNERARNVARIVLRLRAAQLLGQPNVVFRLRNLDVAACRRAGNQPGRPFFCLAQFDIDLLRRLLGTQQPVQRYQDDPGTDDTAPDLTTDPNQPAYRRRFRAVRSFNCIVLLRLQATAPGISIVARDCVRNQPSGSPVTLPFPIPVPTRY